MEEESGRCSFVAQTLKNCVMKTKHALIAAGITALFLSGCLPSIHKLYHDDDLVFKSELLGKWQDDDGNTWTFEKDEMGYDLTYVEDALQKNEGGPVSSDFETHLVKLGEYYFFDLYPGDNEQLDMSSLLISSMLPVHIFAKVEFNGNEVVVKFYNPDWLNEMLSEDRIRIAHEKTEDYTVLTASTDELQRFVTKYAEVKEAFVDPLILKRSK